MNDKPGFQRKRQRWLSWNRLLVLTAALAGALVIHFLNSNEIGVINSRETLRLTSAPHIHNRSEELTQRGKPLQNEEISIDAKRLDAAPYKVYTGVYVANNFNLNLKTPSYSSKGFLWLNWNKEMQDYLSEKETTIEKIINLENDINPETSAITPTGDAGASQQPDGSFIQSFIYTGDFFIDNLNLKRFPFNEIRLPIVLEVDDPGDQLNYAKLRLIPSLRDSGIGLYADLTGWLTQGWSIGEYRHHFASTLGLSERDEEYSQIIMDVSYGRSTWSAFWKLIQPLLVVMASIVLITRVSSEFRLEIPIAVLLSLVFLQEGYRSDLPELAYLTFLDKVYVVCYITSFIGFALALYTESQAAVIQSTEDPDKRSRTERRLNLVNQSWPSLCIAGMITAVAITWLSIAD